jgi:hypothetical protein
MTRMFAWFCALIFIGYSGSVTAQQWLEYRPTGGGFRVEIPGTPRVSTQILQSKNGPVNQTSATIDFDNQHFGASYTDLPDIPEGKFRNSDDAILDGARDGAIQGSNVPGVRATLRNERRLIVSGYPARDIVLDTDQNLVSVMRIILVKNRMFSANFVGSSGSETGSSARMSLSSVKSDTARRSRVFSVSSSFSRFT